MQNSDEIIISDVKIENTDHSGLISSISSAIEHNKQCAIAYANANTINLTYKDNKLTDILNSFDIIHPDGIGIYLASRYLFGKNSLPGRFNGSDLYPELAEYAIRNKWRVFFFGNDDETLSKIVHHNPGLNISGLQNGYNFKDPEVITKFNSVESDLLVIGLGTPKQETWVTTFKEKLNCKVIICVGDGIKVFAGSKIRGPKLMRKLGLEWLVRLALNPVKYFSRYVIGNPLFLYRIIILKMRKLAG
jgi:exopolysaccharide biosynthesis WecB/TagA/CpsF family protein